MNPTPYTSKLNKLLCLSIILISITFPCFLCSGLGENRYANCKQPFECGNPSILGELRYPFWGANRQNYCGEPGFELNCVNNTPIIPNSTYNLHVIGTNPQSNLITVAIADFTRNLCPSFVFNKNNTDASILENLSSGRLFIRSDTSLLTILYGCPSKLGHQLSWSGGYSCSTNDSVSVHFVTHTANVTLTQECASVVVLPILQGSAEALDANPSTLSNALENGFEMSWFSLQGDKCATCMGSGGQCGLDWSEHQFTCYCPDSTDPLKCPPSIQGHQNNTPITIGVSIGVVALIALLGGCFVFILQSCKPNPRDRSVEDSLKNYASVAPKRYTYKCIKKMTKSFRVKIGEGGYGSVFKGSLQDGRAVAVKVWKQSKGDGQDFVNEVMSISTTSHVNVVPLLGFCFEGHKRALIYEFMPNGSLEKFLNGNNFDKNNQMLSSQKLLDIAIGVARGLEYLHRGCNTRMVHFDIKPHNILLDAEFIPKISDFGLAKSLKQKESIITMSGARGTAGYIAPEVFCRTFGGVSHKSDVYSFGMMVLEMVGCKKRMNCHNVENSSEAYFPQWIYKQLEQNTSALEGEMIMDEEEKEFERKMILVGLWCIQTNPVCRPAMNRVVEMLEGKTELLEVPPMPILASPPRQQQQQETDNESVNFISSTIYART